MKVKFTKDAVYKAGPRAEWPKYKAGEIYDFDDDHAQRWVRRGVAIVYDAAAKKAEQEEAARLAAIEKTEKANDPSPDLSKLTRAELDLIAADRGVDISQARNKGEVVDILEKAAAEAAKA